MCAEWKAKEKIMIKGNLVEIVKNKMEVCGLEKTRRTWHAMSRFVVPLDVEGEKGCSLDGSDLDNYQILAY